MAKKSVATAHARVVSKAFRSAAFRKKLLRSPHKALASMGYDVPRGYTVKVLENTARKTHIVLPSKPKVKGKKGKAKLGMGPAYTFVG